jgi:hypothetical protein
MLLPIEVVSQTECRDTLVSLLGASPLRRLLGSSIFD